MLRANAVIGITGISFAAIFVRLADLSPITVAFFRLAYAVPILVVVWLFGRSRDHRSLRARLIAVGAGVVFTADLTLWHASIEYIGAGLATVLVNAQIVFVGLIAWVLHGERPSRIAFAAVPIVLVGVVLISGVSGEGYGSNPTRGTVLGLIAAVAYAGFIVLLRMANQGTDAPVAGPLLDATMGAAITTAMIAPFDSAFSAAPSWPAHGWVLLLAIIAQTFGWLLISRTLPRLPALETSLLIIVQPALTLVWSRVFFDEAPNAAQWLGVVVVLAGVTVVAGRSTAQVTRSPAATARST